MQTSVFGTLSDGTTIHRFVLRNAVGAELDIIEYGGAIVSLRVPDREGRLTDVVLGFEDLSGYLTGNAYIGALIGRYGNRIARGRFELAGAPVVLATNDGDNHLHGGDRGFDKVRWRGEPVPGANAVDLFYTSPDGEEGYPGRLDVRVRYTWTDDCVLGIDYEATTDRATVVNLTQHSYFNLSGRQGTSILDHELQLFAGRMTPGDEGLIPTGAVLDVEGTPFDFREARIMGDRIDAPHEQLDRAGGYDHNFVVDGPTGQLRPAAVARHAGTGISMAVQTTEPGIQFYAGNFLDGAQIGKGGARYARRTGFCLETQHFPDSPNHPDFPTTVLGPGEVWRSRTEYRFSADDRA